MRPQRLSSLILVFVCMFLSHIFVSKYTTITIQLSSIQIQVIWPRIHLHHIHSIRSSQPIPQPRALTPVRESYPIGLYYLLIHLCSHIIHGYNTVIALLVQLDVFNSGLE